MMGRRCRMTGRRCVYDKETHRCKCGGWERGYKPKVEPVRDRAECQICERTQAIDKAGLLGHHGYKRPGWGCIQGDCFGVKHKPYPETDALEQYLDIIRKHIAKCQQDLAALIWLEEYEYRYTVGHSWTGKKETRWQTIKKGDRGHYDFEKKHTFPSFEDVIASEKRGIENEIKFAQADEKRVEKRIEAAAAINA